MGSPPVRLLRRYLLDGCLSRTGCLRTHDSFHRLRSISRTLSSQASSQVSPQAQAEVSLRQQWNREMKETKQQKRDAKRDSQVVDGWELTVGIEVHAQLNTAHKLFSVAATSFNDAPNTHVAPFDLALPGSQPLLQREVLIPALRAALALNCTISEVSRFDRKHYFWWDQPSGYQITQYYEPFAKDGSVTLFDREGLPPQERKSSRIRIKQIQLEQDTAKTTAPGGVHAHLLDFNRVGAPLIEIITHTDIHHPRTAAAFVRKVQLLLNSADACVLGMEAGGLRADVNVSVRRTDENFAKLGTRTEIKNLSTIKAVEDAIIAERDRQICELEAGGTIAGETRGWSIDAKETRRIRSKEGEMDYRYMPDPDIAPLLIGKDLLAYLGHHLPTAPDAELDRLIDELGLSFKDASALISLDDGARVEYFHCVLDLLTRMIKEEQRAPESVDIKACATLASNWVLHEFGRLMKSNADQAAVDEFKFAPDGECSKVPAVALAELLLFLYKKQITGKVAKELLIALSLGRLPDGVGNAIEANSLWFKELSEAEYSAVAHQAIKARSTMLQGFNDFQRIPHGKLMYLVGTMLRLGPTERIDPAKAENVLRTCLERQFNESS